MITENEIANINLLFKENSLNSLLIDLMKAIRNEGLNEANRIFDESIAKKKRENERMAADFFYNPIRPDKELIESSLESLLKMSIQIGELPTVRFLIVKKTDTLEKNEFLLDSLLYACQNRQVEIIKYFLEKEDISLTKRIKSNFCCYVFNYARHVDKEELSFTLLRNDYTNLDEKKILHDTLFYWALLEGQTELIKYFIEDKNYNPIWDAPEFCYPLHMASKSYNISMLQYLVKILELGGYPNYINKKDLNGDLVVHSLFKFKPHFEASNLDTDLARTQFIAGLVELGADVTLPNGKGETLLHLAAQTQNIDTIKYLITQHQLNIHQTDDEGNTPIHIAARASFAIMQYLIELGANVLQTNNKGETLLHLAAQANDIAQLKYLLSHTHINTDQKDNEGDTPLSIVLNRQSSLFLQYLFEYGADKIQTNDKGETLLHVAANTAGIAHRMEIIKYLVNQHKMDVHQKDNEGNTPLLSMIKSSCSHWNSLDLTRFDELEYRYIIEMLDFLIDSGSNINAQDGLGNTAFHLLASTWAVNLKQNFTLVQYFFEKKSDINLQNHSGRTPVHNAIEYDRSNFIAYCIENKLDIRNLPAENGDTPLHLAAKKDHYSLIGYLIENQNADINQKNHKGDTPLHLAAKEGHPKAVRYLLEKNAFAINQKNQDGFTPFDFAILQRNCILLFLDKGACFDPKLNNGNTILHFAAKGYDEDTLSFLIKKYGVSSLNEKNDEGYTPLHLAVIHGNEKIFHNSIFYNLKKYNLNIHQQDKYGNNLLHLALLHKHRWVSRPLSAIAINIYQENDEGVTPLDLVATTRTLWIMDNLIRYNPFINQPESGYSSPFHYAAIKGHLSIIQYMLENCQWDMNKKNVHGETALELAVAHGHHAIVDYLIKKLVKNGSDITQRNECPESLFYGLTLLQVAIYQKQFHLVDYFIEQQKIDIYSQTPAGESFLHSLIKASDLLFLSYLIEQKGMDFNPTDARGNTLLHVAALNGQMKIAKYLIEQKGMDGKQTNGYGNTAAHMACVGGHLDMLQYLVQVQEMNFNQKNTKGNTLLHIASGYEHVAIVDYLAGKDKIDFDEKNNRGNTPLHLVTKKGNDMLADYLLEMGVDSDRQNYAGETPLHISVRLGNLTMLEIFIKKGAHVDVCDNNGHTIIDLILAKIGGNFNTPLCKALLRGFKARINGEVNQGTDYVMTEMEKGNVTKYEAAAKYHSLIRQISSASEPYFLLKSNDLVNFMFLTTIKIIKLNLALIIASLKQRGEKEEDNAGLVAWINFYKEKLEEIGKKLNEVEPSQSYQNNPDYMDIGQKIKYFEWKLSKINSIGSNNRGNSPYFKLSNTGKIDFSENSSSTHYVYNHDL